MELEDILSKLEDSVRNKVIGIVHKVNDKKAVMKSLDKIFKEYAETPEIYKNIIDDVSTYPEYAKYLLDIFSSKEVKKVLRLYYIYEPELIRGIVFTFTNYTIEKLRREGQEKAMEYINLLSEIYLNNAFLDTIEKHHPEIAETIILETAYLTTNIKNVEKVLTIVRDLYSNATIRQAIKFYLYRDMSSIAKDIVHFSGNLALRGITTEDIAKIVYRLYLSKEGIKQVAEVYSAMGMSNIVEVIFGDILKHIRNGKNIENIFDIVCRQSNVYLDTNIVKIMKAFKSYDPLAIVNVIYIINELAKRGKSENYIKNVVFNIWYAYKKVPSTLRHIRDIVVEVEDDKKIEEVLEVFSDPKFVTELFRKFDINLELESMRPHEKADYIIALYKMFKMQGNSETIYEG